MDSDIDKKITFFLEKQGIFEPDPEEYEPAQMRFYYSEKRKYKDKFDRYYAEFRNGTLEI